MEICIHCGLSQSCAECRVKLPIKLEGERKELVEDLLNVFVPMPLNSTDEERKEYEGRRMKFLRGSPWLKCKMEELRDLHRRVVRNKK